MGILAVITKEEMEKKSLDKLDKVKSIARKAADGIAIASQLSPQQVQDINNRRQEYLQKQKQDDKSGKQQVADCLGAIDIEITQAYLPQLSRIYQPLPWEGERSLLENRIRFFDITKWVVDTSEKSLDKLTSVYQALSNDACSIALIYTRQPAGCTVTMAVENDLKNDDPTIANGFCDRLRDALRGNFPGAELGEQCKGVPTALRIFPGRCTVASVSNLVSERSEDFVSQSIEKLLDGIVPKSEDETYSIVLLAQPFRDLSRQICRLYELYSQLSPYATWQKNSGSNESLAKTASANAGVNIAPLGVGIAFGRAATDNVTFGQSESSMECYTNYAVKHTLEILEHQVKRLEQCASLGTWEFAAYVISPDYKVVNNVAHMYLSLTQGEQSYMEQAAINCWVDESQTLLLWLQALQHPQFVLNKELTEAIKDCLQYPAWTTAAAVLSGDELAHALNFPRRSVGGLPVYECVPFGREVVQHAHDPNKPTVPLGRIYHMRQEGDAAVKLDRDSLTAHTFVTGSTGAGKSNTIYTMLNKLCLSSEEQTHFLVIEPAKGEYKDALGGYSGVSVYGTNPYKTPMLRLNPFSFPEDTHVLEHIDRLVEVFNACWPMYAAMPAVLKATVEQAYKTCGWSLKTSRCLGTRRFPTFLDVMQALPEVVDSKGFSNDTQGDYKGSLLTRLESLTNGINGQVLCASNELAAEALFDCNVIVDLSRVGSSETKALLMGVLVLKLQEHRMAQRTAGVNRPNSGLQHITVLEEAHNLLRRTSTEQNQESSNLQGKSVEMLTNAIAEMRTYGEGFIIADQAPGLLDMAAIRNTNTKIILRLPDEGDRMLVGKAAGLNDDQIVELSRLDTGVAVAYQNHWLEPVLCKVEHFGIEKPYQYKYKAESDSQPGIHNFLMRLFALSDDKELSQEDVDAISQWIDGLDQGPETKRLMRKVPNGKPLTEGEQQIVAYNVFEGKQMIRLLEDSWEEKEGIRRLDARLQCMDDVQNETLAIRLRQLILKVVIEQTGMEQFKSRFAVYATEGRPL